MKPTPIVSPLPGEHLAATSPLMQPETTSARWRLRLNFWAGRSLSADALEIEQAHRGGRLARRGRLATPGVVRGLEVALEAPNVNELTRAGYFVHVLPGYGILADGEDVAVSRPLRVPLDRIPIEYVRVGGTNHQPPSEAPPSDATPRASLDTGDRIVIVDRFGDAHLPWAAVLVLVPAELAAVRDDDPDDPCELDPSQDPFSDERRVDAAMLRLCELPAAWRTLPLLGADNDTKYRNRLAHIIFSEEARIAARQQIGRREAEHPDQRWDTALAAADLMPWEWRGVPVALVAAEQRGDSQRTFFIDRQAVARPGGGVRQRSRPALHLATDGDPAAIDPRPAGTPALWRARIDQFAAQLSTFSAANADAIAQAASSFQFVPAAGFLPRAALDLLTTDEARQLPHAPDRNADRAGTNHFFPGRFAAEATPVATEDLDAALAASAPLAPYDLDAPDGAEIRLLVPVPQRFFEPDLLVVEDVDPLFQTTLDQFLAVRQGWRQRRDFVRSKRDVLQALVDGPQPPAPPVALEPGQLEEEPVETVDSLSFTKALVSPVPTGSPTEIIADTNPEMRNVAGELFFLVRIDEESSPNRIDARWTVDANEVQFTWTNPHLERHADVDAQGRPLPLPLWMQLSTRGSALDPVTGQITSFALHVEGGRIALATAGWIDRREEVAEEVFWRAGDDTPRHFVGSDWTLVTGGQLLAPFEEPYDPVFPDARTREQRTTAIENALNPAGTTPRAVAMSVAADGLAQVLAVLDAEANEADDFVDAHFTRAQVNLYRVRKLMLGQTAAQKLLINPAIAAIAEQETATASADQLQAFVEAAKSRPKITPDAIKAALNPPATRAGLLNIGAISSFVPVNPVVTKPAGVVAAESTLLLDRSGLLVGRTETIARSPQLEAAAEQVSRIDIKAEVLRGVVGERPEAGPTLPPRGLSIGSRFVEPPATQNLSYARADVTQLLNQLPTLRIPLVGVTVKGLNGQDVSLLALQGRVQPPATDTTPPPTPESIRNAAITALLTFTAPDNSVDEAEVTLAALDFMEVKTAILRTIERVVQARRDVIQTGTETLTLISEQAGLAAARVLAIAGTLAAARHDVSVTRALLQEEQQRVDGINEERDRVIAHEVTFLAYARPRAVELVRRRTPYWQLDLFGAPAPVPACLQRHDEPPAPLNAYIELLNQSPVRWFTALDPLLARLDTPDKLIALIESSRTSAIAFRSVSPVTSIRAASEAVQVTVLGAHQLISTLRQQTALVEIGDRRLRRWQDYQRDARDHATVGDLIAGKFGSRDVSTAAAAELEQIGQVATCLHAEFAAVAPAIRLAWIERFSQFDQPAPLRDLTVLPQYAQLDRVTRRRLQQFVDWLFGRVSTAEPDALNLVNDLVRLCLLLASHAPVNQIIAGHVPRPTPVRPNLQIPIRPLNPEQVRVGMEVHVWQASKIVARGLVEDLVPGEVTARLKTVDAQTKTIDPSMRIQFVAPALSFLR